jgi:hypothetical protein
VADDFEDPKESQLAFELRAVPGGTELTLTHSALASAETRSSYELVRYFPATATT